MFQRGRQSPDNFSFASLIKILLRKKVYLITIGDSRVVIVTAVIMAPL